MFQTADSKETFTCIVISGGYQILDQNYARRLYTALFTMAYYGLFWVGEITKGSHPILARDVHTGKNKKKLLFILRSSKMHSKNAKPQIVKIAAIPKSVTNKSKPNNQTQFSTHWCPFQILRAFLQARPSFISDKEPFFVFRDRSPVSPNNFTSVLKILLKDGGYDETRYSSHGFRGVRSRDLLEMGVPIDTIRKLSRWSPKSSLVYAYLEF